MTVSFKGKRNRNILALLAAVLILNLAALYVGYSIYSSVKFNLINSSEAQQLTEIERIQSEIDLLYNAGHNDAVWLAKMFNILSMEHDLRKNNQDIADILFTFAQTHSRYSEIIFINEFGKEIIKVSNAEGEPVNHQPDIDIPVSCMACFDAAVKAEEGQGIYSTMEIASSSGDPDDMNLPTVRFATQTHDKKGELLGIVMLSYSPAEYFAALKKSNVFILDQNGTYIASNDSSMLYKTAIYDLGLKRQFCPMYQGFVYLQSAGPPEKPIYIGAHAYHKEISEILQTELYKLISIFGLIFTLSLGTTFGVFFFYQNRDAKILVEQSERLSAIGRISNIIVHDLKGPLTVIKAICDIRTVLGKKDGIPQEALDDYQTMNEAVDQQVEMIQEILDFSKGKELKLKLVKVGLKEYLTKRLEADSKYLKRFEVISKIEFETDIFIDPARFNRVIDNLLKNAGEAIFGRKNAMILITTRKADNMAEIIIADNGPGIPEEMKPRMFKLGATSGKDKGTGIGLYSVRTITELHGGTIDYSSKPNEGTTFNIRLPL